MNNYFGKNLRFLRKRLKISQEEVAVTLKTTRKAIEMRLYRARHRLSEIMLEEEPET